MLDLINRNLFCTSINKILLTVEGDEEFVFEVLNMILKKTDELMGEAQVDSQKFVVTL